MLSLSTPNPLSLSDHHRNRHKSILSSTFLSTIPSLFNFPSSTNTTPSKPPLSKPISAANQPSPPQIGIIPAQSRNPQPQNLYQPFRPPPSPLPPKFRNLDTAGRIEVLTNRLGVWFEYAPLISALAQEGFTPSTLEELTGISGVEQNRLIVAAQVRETLAQSSQLEPEILSYFDQGGAELLYEIRLLSASQRAAAARYLVVNRLDGDGARDVARAIKDFPRRKKDVGWNCFDYNLTGDCVAFMYFRQALEHPNPSDKRTMALQSAIGAVESDKARKRVLEELEGKGDASERQEEMEIAVTVPVVRLKIGEVAESTSVVVLPVCKEEDKEAGVLSAPFKCDSEGEFGVVTSDKGWDRWVVLPGWEPVAGLGKGGVVVSFANAKVLPWKVNNKWYKDEPILVVADRVRKEVMLDDGFYLVMRNRDDDVGDGLKVERGSTLKGIGVQECLGTVVMVVRPPKDEIDDELSEEDWD